MIALAVLIICMGNPPDRMTTISGTFAQLIIHRMIGLLRSRLARKDAIGKSGTWR
jgi:hypothetical protein